MTRSKGRHLVDLYKTRCKREDMLKLSEQAYMRSLQLWRRLLSAVRNMEKVRVTLGESFVSDQHIAHHAHKKGRYNNVRVA